MMELEKYNWMLELCPTKFGNGIYVCFQKSEKGEINKVYIWSLDNIKNGLECGKYKVTERLCPKTTAEPSNKVWKPCIDLPKSTAWEYEKIDNRWALVKNQKYVG